MFESPYDYCTSEDIPSFLRHEADPIKKSGAIVAVLGFKGFKEKHKKSDPDHFSKLIREAVAENFAIAICSQMLTIKVQTEDGKADIIDESQILDFLKHSASTNADKHTAVQKAQLTLEAIESFRNSETIL